MTCPRCNSTDTEPLDNGMSYCPGCDHAWRPEQPSRLIDPPERTRKDLDE